MKMNSVFFQEKKVYPTKVVCAGRNYLDHIKELNNQTPDEIVLFMKPNSAIGPQLILPAAKCRYEGEITFIFENGIIGGVGFGIDLTLTDVQNRLKDKGFPWEKSKSFNNSAVFTDFVPFRNLENLHLQLWVNGELRQAAGVSSMITKPSELIEEVNDHFTLDDYDLLMTGTPKGVATINRGEHYKGMIFEDDQLLVEKEWHVI